MSASALIAHRSSSPVASFRRHAVAVRGVPTLYCFAREKEKHSEASMGSSPGVRDLRNEGGVCQGTGSNSTLTTSHPAADTPFLLRQMTLDRRISRIKRVATHQFLS